MSNFTDKRFSFATFMIIYLFQVAGIGFFYWLSRGTFDQYPIVINTLVPLIIYPIVYYFINKRSFSSVDFTRHVHLIVTLFSIVKGSPIGGVSLF